MPVPPWQLAQHPNPPRTDGAWRTDEVWDPFTKLPGDFRWWRKPLGPYDQVEYQTVGDPWEAVLVTVVLGDGRRVGLWSTDVARVRVVMTEVQPTGLYAHRMIVTHHLAVDVLTNLPPYQLIPWRPLTDPGDTDPPNPSDRPEPGYGPTRAVFHQQSAWFPPNPPRRRR